MSNGENTVDLYIASWKEWSDVDREFGPARLTLREAEADLPTGLRCCGGNYIYRTTINKETALKALLQLE